MVQQLWAEISLRIFTGKFVGRGAGGKPVHNRSIYLRAVSWFSYTSLCKIYLFSSFLGDRAIHVLGVEEDTLVEAFVVAEFFPNVWDIISNSIFFACLVEG